MPWSCSKVFPGHVILFVLKKDLRVDSSDSTLAFLSPVLSSRSDGLQPEPPVFSDAGSALQRPRRTSRDAAGPLHSGLHAAAVHDAVLQREGHCDDWQHPRQLRGFPVWSHHQAHVSVTPWTVCFIPFASVWQFYTVYNSSGVRRKVKILQCGLIVKVHCLF